MRDSLLAAAAAAAAAGVESTQPALTAVDVHTMVIAGA
jgi:hypothetical protein